MKFLKWILLSTTLTSVNTLGAEQDLVSHWKMDSVANGLVDHVGNNNGVLYGAPITVAGKFDSAVLFDGVDDTALVADDSSLDFGSDDFTVSFWFKKLSNTTNWKSCPGIQKWNTGGNRGTNEWALGLCASANTNDVTFGIESGRQVYGINDTSAIELNKWYFVAGVRDGHYLKLYVDGVLKGTKEIGNISVNNVGRPLTMATRRSPSGAFSGFTNVIFDEVKIYNNARQVSDLLQDMELSPARPKPKTKLVSHWKMDKLNNRLEDSIGNNHGTLFGNLSVTEGQVNSAILFDGIDDTVVVPDDTSLDFGSDDFAVSFWFKKLSHTSNWDNCPGVQKWNNGGHRGTNEWALGLCASANTNDIAFGIESGNQTFSIRDTNATELNKWYFVVGTRDGDFLKLYVDGQLVSSKYIGSIAVNNVGRSLTMATRRSPSGVTSGYSNVIFDEVKIFDGSLSKLDVSAEYQINGRAFADLIDASATHAFVIDKNSTLLGWGKNRYGQLGIGSKENKLVPTQAKNITASKVATGRRHTLALDSSNQLYAWGAGKSGRLGFSQKGTLKTPKPVPISSVKDISVGFHHSLAIKEDGTLWSWGDNGYGQLGTLPKVSSSTPKKIDNFNNVVAVSGGGFHTLAVTGDGKVWAWGRNNSGSLGNGSTVNSSTPVEVNNLTSVIKVSAGYSHSLALTADGKVWAWGWNSNGQIGNGLKGTDLLIPVTVKELSSVNDISAGDYHSAAVAIDGTVWTWGSNIYGQLGTGDYVDSLIPVQIPNISNAVAVVAGARSTVILTSKGEVYTFGRNDNGQLGDGTTVDSPSPVKILENILPN